MKKYIFLITLFTCIGISHTFADFDTSSEYTQVQVQKYPLSCEFSALRGILAKISGNIYTEDTLIDMAPKSFWGKSATIKNGVRVWGDPEIGYVGNISGNQNNYTGYGIYEKGIQKIADSLGFVTTTRNAHEYRDGFTTELHLNEIITALENGKGVLLLGDYCTDPKFEDGQKNSLINNTELKKGINAKNICKAWGKNRITSWKTERNGKLENVEALVGDHAFILTGYEGTKEHITAIKVFDTDTGFHTYPIQEWLRKWSMMANRSLIIEKAYTPDWMTPTANTVKQENTGTITLPSLSGAIENNTAGETSNLQPTSLEANNNPDSKIYTGSISTSTTPPALTELLPIKPSIK